MDNHHHCVVCGDVIDATSRTCSKIDCVKRDEQRKVRCHKIRSNYIFSPGKCVETCKGYKISGKDYDGDDIVECCQEGKTPPRPRFR